MTRLTICVLAALILALAIPFGGFDRDHVAMAKAKTDPHAEACKECYDRCPKLGGTICRIHCQNRAGCPAPKTSAP